MRILFITTGNSFEKFQQDYAVTSAGVVPNLAVAGAILAAEDNPSPPEAVLIGVDMPLPQVVPFIRRHSTMPHLKNVRWVVVTDRDTDFMASELEGVAHAVPRESSPADLARLIGVRQTKSAGTLFISALNVKGGTGKTTFLTHLGEALARRGLQTALVDADVVDGDVAQAVGVPQTGNTIDKLAGELSAPNARRGALLKHYLYPRSKNLYVLPAPGRSDYSQDYLNEVTAQFLLNILSAARFDAVLVDLPGHLRSTPFTQSLARQTLSRFYLLYHPEKVFERAGFTRALQVLQGLKVQNQADIIALGCEGGGPWTQPEQESIEQTTGLSVAAFIPYDPIVRRAQAAGQTVFELLQGKNKGLFGVKSPYVQVIETLADAIVAGKDGE